MAGSRGTSLRRYALTRLALVIPMVFIVLTLVFLLMRAIPGDPALVDIEARLAQQPDITVPAIVLMGADDGVDPPSPVDHDRQHFTASYERRIVAGAGHNLPQEKPDVFADAVLSLARLR